MIKKVLPLLFMLSNISVLYASLEKYTISVCITSSLENALTCKYKALAEDVKSDVFIVKENEKYFQLYVQDNGPGISDENKEAVFRRFYRADPARKEKQHFGLGLCIAREIVTLHKGSIRILDTPGGGSTFVIRLPK